MAIAYLGENQIGGGGGDENVIESISVNNVTQQITDKNVNITVPSAPGTLNTTATTAQSTSSSEALSGSVTLHKVAKTGTYSDLIGTPNIPLAIYFDPSNQTLYFFKSTADRDSFVANKTQTSLIMFSTDTSPYIKFRDANVLSALLAKNIGDGVGITEAQAAAVTNMNYVFYENTNISTFDEGVYFTGAFQWAGAFRGSSVTRVKLPMGLRATSSTGAWAGIFYDCTSLREIDFADLERLPIADNSQLQWFSGCSSLTTISFDNIEQIFKFTLSSRFFPSDVPFGVNNDIHHVYVNGHELREVVIPSTITAIRPGTFYRFNRITSVTIPSGVLTIGNSAFKLCSSLGSLTIPSTVTLVDGSAFEDCSGISGDVTVPDGCDLGSYSFSACTGITNLTLAGASMERNTNFSTTSTDRATGNGDGTLRVAGNLTHVSNYFLCFKRIIISGNFTVTAGSTGSIRQKPVNNMSPTELIKIGGNYSTNGTNANAAAILMQCGKPSILSFVEIMGTITSSYPIFGADGANYLADGAILHLGYDASTNNALPCTPEIASASFARLSKIYVGIGNASADSAILNKYLADSAWSQYSSKLATWYSYNGTYKNIR